eukprot:TRINITY_DN1467_c0_g1_i1.p2 TRINITY_DN1467_c0_g1~~TRINITY_DN1467_c0_g1_i1.p2  ORF type:complete len:407 (-),score=278.04 TRINITY_DN1467_c0_g1_i1:103-1323(-)
MVCCANYWRLHEVDEAGRVGSRLQKILFFLSALVTLTFLTLNPIMVLGATAALVLYGIGLHGAQKRNEKALAFYGTTMLCSVILTVLTVAFIGGFLLVGGAHRMHHQYAPEARHHRGRGHWGHSMTQAVHEHAVSNLMSMSESSGFVTYDHEHVSDDGVEFTLVDLVPAEGAEELPAVEIAAVRDDLVSNERGERFELVTLETVPKADSQKPADAIIGDAVALAEQQIAAEADGEAEAEAAVEGSAEADRTAHSRRVPHVRTCRITPLGYAALFLAIFMSLLCFALKVRSIKLAFQMRAMLLANARQQLPLHTRSTSRARPTPQRAAAPSSSSSTRGVRPPQTPAPMRRRDCAACTFVNVASAVRCAMCDSPLPFAAAPAGVAPPSSSVPRVYVPGSLYPLNAPLN